MTQISPLDIFEQMQTIQADLNRLEDLIYRVVVSQADKIEELENLVDPYCNSGNSICNSHWER